MILEWWLTFFGHSVVEQIFYIALTFN